MIKEGNIKLERTLIQIFSKFSIGKKILTDF